MRFVKTCCLFLIAFLLTVPYGFSQNKTVLFSRDFDGNAPSAFDLNSSSGNANYGINQWVINDKYDGQGIYPDTPPQDSTANSLGKIGNPNQNYLHIRDFNSAPENATYDPTVSSDRWAVMTSGICTHQFDAVTLTFWWTGNGSPSAFGEVYYSTDGGNTWQLTTNFNNRTKYRNATKWNYSEITMSDFKSQDNLLFAFRWMNRDQGNSGELSFSVDDIIVVGSYDESEQDSTLIQAIDLTPSPVCHEDPINTELTFTFNVQDTLCPGRYLIEFSDSACNFDDPIPFAGFNVNSTLEPGINYQVSGDLPIPTSIPKGDCYCFRINRISAPTITGEPNTGCFEIADCLDSIKIPQTPPVMQDPTDTGSLPSICKRSVIDVPFLSFGGFNPGNNYYLVLSDSNGVFRTPDTIGGPMPSTQTYDPRLYPNRVPGFISGVIPEDVPPGCNYYLRVNSTNPKVKGQKWGPFCIKECDIITNDGQDITPSSPMAVCVTDTDSVCIPVPYEIKYFDSTFSYGAGNTFWVQILSMQNGSILIDSAFGQVKKDTTSGAIEMCIPPLSEYPLDPSKMYYLRVASTKPSDPYNQYGSMIRFKPSFIGGGQLSLNIPGSMDTATCGSDETICLTVSSSTSLSSNSDYLLTFYDSSGNELTTFTWKPYQSNHPNLPTFCFRGSIFPSGTYTVTVTERHPQDTGCVGTTSDPDTFVIISYPFPDFTGDFKVCVGDTVTYYADFYPRTYYSWEQNGGTIIDTSNTQVTIAWESTGLGNVVKLYAINQCGGQPVQKSVTVLRKTRAKAFRDTSICYGNEIMLEGLNQTTNFNNAYRWSNLRSDTSYTHKVIESDGDSVSQMSTKPDTTTSFVFEADNAPPDGCIGKDTVRVEVARVHFGGDTSVLCQGDTMQMDPTVEGGSSFKWEPSTSLSNTTTRNPQAWPQNTIQYKLVAEFQNGCKDTSTLAVRVKNTNFKISPDDTIVKHQSADLFAQGGSVYSWTPPTTLQYPNTAAPVASPDSTTTYTVNILNKKTGCEEVEKVTIYVHEPDILIPKAFSPNGDGSNDSFKPVYLAIKDLHVFKVFNRWGEKVFETSSKEEAWDGTYKGAKQEVGTYMYYVEGETVENKVVNREGNVTLIR